MPKAFSGEDASAHFESIKPQPLHVPLGGRDTTPYGGFVLETQAYNLYASNMLPVVTERQKEEEYLRERPHISADAFLRAKDLFEKTYSQISQDAWHDFYHRTRPYARYIGSCSIILFHHN